MHSQVKLEEFMRREFQLLLELGSCYVPSLHALILCGQRVQVFMDLAGEAIVNTRLHCHRLPKRNPYFLWMFDTFIYRG